MTQRTMSQHSYHGATSRSQSVINAVNTFSNYIMTEIYFFYKGKYLEVLLTGIDLSLTMQQLAGHTMPD